MNNIWDKKIIMAPSLICLDLLNLERDVEVLESVGVSVLHVDLLDGYFSPSMPIGIDTLAQLKKRTKLMFDCHVMASQNDFFVNKLLDMGVEQLTFHIETEPHPDAMLNRVKAAGARAGVALKPGTPLNSLEYLIEKCDVVLMMLINPGFAYLNTETQSPYAEKKLGDLKALMSSRGLDIPVTIDGRVSQENIQNWGGSLANIFVAGSTLLTPGNIAGCALKLMALENPEE